MYEVKKMNVCLWFTYLYSKYRSDLHTQQELGDRILRGQVETKAL